MTSAVTPPARPRAENAANSRLVRDVRSAWQDALLDEGLKETFPASDPVSVALVD